MTQNDRILAAHQFRYATKKFNKDKVISETDFATILESARISPSSFGYEPWKILWIKDETIKEGLRPDSWGAHNSLDGASHFLIVLARKDVTANSEHVRHIVEDVKGFNLANQARGQARFDAFQKEDFKLTASPEGLFDWASKQTYIMMANMMTTAAYLEIDSCPIEGFHRDNVEAFLESKGILDTTKYGVSYMLGLGYRDEVQGPKTRQTLEDILTII